MKYCIAATVLATMPYTILATDAADNAKDTAKSEERAFVPRPKLDEFLDVMTKFYANLELSTFELQIEEELTPDYKNKVGDIFQRVLKKRLWPLFFTLTDDELSDFQNSYTGGQMPAFLRESATFDANFPEVRKKLNVSVLRFERDPDLPDDLLGAALSKTAKKHIEDRKIFLGETVIHNTAYQFYQYLSGKYAAEIAKFRDMMKTYKILHENVGKIVNGNVDEIRNEMAKIK